MNRPMRMPVIFRSDDSGPDADVFRRVVAVFLRFRFGLLFTWAVRVVRMRARSSEAGSSRGSCGTNSPRNAFARIDWSSCVRDDSDSAI